MLLTYACCWLGCSLQEHVPTVLHQQQVADDEAGVSCQVMRVAHGHRTVLTVWFMGQHLGQPADAGN